jgi:hypothetical protein
MMGKTIRFGIMCAGTQFHKWQAEALSRLMDMQGVTPELLIVDSSSSTTSKTSLVLRYVKAGQLLWNAYLLLIRRKFKATRKVDLSEALKGVKTIHCQIVKKGKFSEYFKLEDIAEIRAANLDFIMRFGFGIIRGEVLQAARYGVWSFHHDDEEKYRGGPPCFWEIYRNDKVTASVLQKLTDKLDAGVILKKGYMKTKYAYVRNRDQMYFESAKWPAILCLDIRNNNQNAFNKPPSPTGAKIYRAPNNWQFISFIVKTIYYRLVAGVRQHFFVDYWNIGIAKAHISRFLDDEKPEVHWFPIKSKRKFHADPFALPDAEDPDKINVFFETFEYKNRKGIIDYTCYEGKYSAAVKVIAEPEHLSYPYLLFENEEIILIPECFESGAVYRYTPEKFPLKWKSRQVILDGFPGVDNTVIKRDGLYWLFTSDKRDAVQFNLHLFYSESLLGHWAPHPKNPVKTDIRSARSAGTPFEYQNELYRPGMDYSEKVEGGIVINKVVTLSKTEFEEIPVKKIEPYSDAYFSDKIHTLSTAGNYTVIDGAREAFIFTNWTFLRHKFALMRNKLQSILKKGS